MRPTRFPSRAAGPAERVSGFIAHLRLNGLRAGPRETEDALTALAAVDALDADEARLALKTLLAPDREIWLKFDDLFDAYWFNAGRQRQTTAPAAHLRRRRCAPSFGNRISTRTMRRGKTKAPARALTTARPKTRAPEGD
jgi:uncharacterized protein